MRVDLEIGYLEDDPRVVSTLAEWIYEAWGKNVPGRTLETAHAKVRQTVGSRAIPLTLVGFANGEPVGTASIDTADMATHPELSPWLASVYVKPDHRRRGICALLCERAREELRRLGVERAYLFTFDQERLYERLGWKTILRDRYRDEPVAIMRLDP